MIDASEANLSRLRSAIWLLPAALAVHEFEEWNILGWYRANWVNLDAGTMTELSVHVWLFFLSALGFLVTWAAPASLGLRRGARLVVLPAFVIVILGHAGAHIFWTVRFGSYAPGVVTSVLLIIPATLFVLRLASRLQVAGRSYCGLLLLGALVPVAAAVRAGNVIPEGGVPWLRFSTWLISLWPA